MSPSVSSIVSIAPRARSPQLSRPASFALLASIVLFFLAQRAFVEGVTLTGVKG